MMDPQSWHIGSQYLYEGARVRLRGTHAALNLGTGKIECSVTIQMAGGQRREVLPYEIQEEPDVTC